MFRTRIIEKLKNDIPASKILELVFNYEDPWNPKDKAFVRIFSFDKELNYVVVGSRWITKEQYKEGSYHVSINGFTICLDQKGSPGL